GGQLSHRLVRLAGDAIGFVMVVVVVRLAHTASVPWLSDSSASVEIVPGGQRFSHTTAFMGGLIFKGNFTFKHPALRRAVRLTAPPVRVMSSAVLFWS
ncbi:hypothetical protein CWR41_00530, partial [Cedecea lapagei]